MLRSLQTTDGAALTETETGEAVNITSTVTDTEDTTKADGGSATIQLEEPTEGATINAGTETMEPTTTTTDTTTTILPASGCSHAVRENMGLNNNVHSYRFYGIMFALRTTKAINITTLEVDIRLDKAEDDLDLEVYTLSGDYYGLNGNESAWQQIANTRATPLPDGGAALIPVQKFDTVVMAADELRSFYITMKGPYIDSFASAMIDRGERDREFDAFRLDVGGGLSEYKFPASFDNTVNPKFAGAIHYQENTECEPPVQTLMTKIEFDFLLDIFEYDEPIFGQVAAAVKELLDDEFSNPNGVLKDSAEQHSLRLAANPSGESPRKPLPECSGAFDYCTGVTVYAKFEHSASLSGAEAEYLIYGLADKVANYAAGALEKKLSFVGNSNVSANFKMVIAGVPSDALLSDSLQKYFGQFVIDSLSGFQPALELLDMIINEQNRVQRRMLQDGSALEIDGTIRGLQFYYTESKEFAETIQLTLEEHSQTLIDRLTFNMIVPSNEVTEDDASIFMGVTSITMTSEAVPRDYNPPKFWNTVPPTPTPPDDVDDGVDVVGKTGDAIDDVIGEAADVDSNIWMIIGACAAVVVVLLCIGCFWCRLRRRRKMRIPKDKNKEEEAVCSDAETAKQTNTYNANRSVDTTLGDDELHRSRGRSKQGSIRSDLTSESPRNSVQRSLSFDSAESAVPSQPEGRRTIQRSMSADGSQLGPSLQGRRLQRSMSADGAQFADPSPTVSNATTPGSSRRGKKPQRTVSAGAPGAQPLRGAAPGGNGPPVREPPQRSHSTDGMPARGPTLGQPPGRPMVQQRPPSVRVAPRRTASEGVAAMRQPPMRNTSGRGAGGPTRLPTGTPQGYGGLPANSRLPTNARVPPQRSQSARPAGCPVPPGGVHRMPSMRDHTRAQPSDLNGSPQQTH